MAESVVWDNYYIVLNYPVFLIELHKSTLIQYSFNLHVIVILMEFHNASCYSVFPLEAWGGHVTTTCGPVGVAFVKELGADEIVDISG